MWLRRSRGTVKHSETRRARAARELVKYLSRALLSDGAALKKFCPCPDQTCQETVNVVGDERNTQSDQDDAFVLFG